MLRERDRISDLKVSNENRETEALVSLGYSVCVCVCMCACVRACVHESERERGLSYFRLEIINWGEGGI